jgi:hypothetical protein
MNKDRNPSSVPASEAQEALAAIQTISKKTRQSIASGGTYITLIVTGAVWLVGFICTQFLNPEAVAYIWAGLSIVGGAIGTFMGIRTGKRVRSPATTPTVKRVLLFWGLLALYGITIIAIAHPTDGKQATLFVVMFIMLGQLAMGLLFSFASVWWALPVTALALVGYLFFPSIFYLWMGILGGGGMVILGIYIRIRW